MLAKPPSEMDSYGSKDINTGTAMQSEELHGGCMLLCKTADEWHAVLQL
jgi:hypothetical protein